MPALQRNIGSHPRMLDVRPDRLDLRDLPYRPSVRSLPPQFPSDAMIAKFLPSYVENNLVLDQGQEGACTGFGLGAVINYLLWVRSETERAEIVSPKMIYHLARFYDEWPGEGYEGSSCRGALKGWHKHGVCLRSKWGTNAPSRAHPLKKGWAEDAAQRPLGVYYRIDKNSVVDMQAAIFETGAVYASGGVHQGWSMKGARAAPTSHAELPIIPYEPTPDGAHAFALVGYNAIGFIVQNSWGRKWGASGFALLTYEDWVTHGGDAWAVSLGVPAAQKLASAKAFVFSAREVLNGPSGRSATSIPSASPTADQHRWDDERARRHALVTGNDGRIINRLVEAGDAVHTAQLVAHDYPHAWFTSNTAAGEPWRVIVYAHGGLNKEEIGIKRVGALGPMFIENGLYPIFTVWKSGAFESLSNLLSDKAHNVFGGPPPSRGLGDAWDRFLEQFSHEVLIRSLWEQMKQNIAASAEDGHGLSALVSNLSALAQTAKEAGTTLEIHLAAHSAGSFIAGYLTSALQKIESCTLLAPACDVKFASAHFGAAFKKRNKLNRARFQIQLLSDQNEQDDTVGPYRKSLLYLVSRALECDHKTPLLGLASAFDASVKTGEAWHQDWQQAAQTWQAEFWGGNTPLALKEDSQTNAAQPHGLYVVIQHEVITGARPLEATHGSFDNSIEAMRLLLKNARPDAGITPPTDLSEGG
jgi:Papain family cysteine protease